MIAAIYARKSTEQHETDTEEKSVTRQVEHAKAYAVRKGWTVADEHVHVDDGISGAEFTNRPGLLRLMNSLKPRPPFHVLIMSEESRLGREAIETAYALKQLVQAGVQVWFYLEDRQRTLESPTDKLLLSVTAFADELEREKARQRTYDAMVRKAKAGHVTGGRVFGYDNVEVTRPGPDGQPRRSHVARRINEVEANVIRQIFSRYALGFGFTAIAKQLNEEGAACPRAEQGRPNGWAPSSIREVLRRPLYHGVIIWNKTRKRDTWGLKKQTQRSAAEWVEVQAPDLRLVTSEQWDAVQVRLAEVRETALRTKSGQLLGRPPAHAVKYLLSGLLRCAECGATLEARSRSHEKRRVMFYGCAGYHKRGRTVCANRLTVPMTDFDTVVLDAVERQVLSPDVLSDALDRAVELLGEAAEQPPRLDEDLQRVEKELQRLTAALAAGGHLETVVKALREREALRAALMAERDRAERTSQLSGADLREALSRRLEDWRGLMRRHVAQSQQLLRRLIDGKLNCRPDLQRGVYVIEGTATLSKLGAGLVPLHMASPRGRAPLWKPKIRGKARVAA